MTQINLRKAANLQTNLLERLRETTVNTNIQITPFENLSVVLEVGLDKLLEDDRRQAALLTALYAIRAQVATANVTSGISSKLTTVAMMDRRIDQIEAITMAGEQMKDEVLRGRLALLKTRAEAGGEGARYTGYGITEALSTSVLDEGTLDRYVAESQSLKRDRQTLKDEILELNMTTKITLDVDTVSTLAREGFI